MTLRATIEAIFEPRVRGASQARKDGDEPSNLMWRTLYDLRAEVLAAIEEHEKEVICREYRVELPGLAQQLVEQEEPKSKWPRCEYPECDCDGQSKVAGKWYCGPHAFMVAQKAHEICQVCHGAGCHCCKPCETKLYEDAMKPKPAEPIKRITGQPYRNTEP